MLDVQDLLSFLEIAPPGAAASALFAPAPGLRALNRLISAYTQKIPWESASRIVRCAEIDQIAQRPREPEAFWQDAMTSGCGGTCFESNFAFFALLTALGYRGYLTVNDMGEQRGCHSAIVLDVQGSKRLVDVGIPLLAALPVDPRRTTRRPSLLHTYSVHPDGPDRYQIQRTHHPHPNIYTLLDTPLSEAAYRRVVEQDYGPQGLFLNRVVLVKRIGGRLWRFNSAELPYHLESFGPSDHQELPLPPGQVVERLAQTFAIDPAILEKALAVVETQPSGGTNRSE
jgi:hypothetical protein